MDIKKLNLEHPVEELPEVDDGFVLLLEGTHLVEIENGGEMEEMKESAIITSYEQYRHLYDTAVWKHVDLYAVPQMLINQKGDSKFDGTWKVFAFFRELKLLSIFSAIKTSGRGIKMRNVFSFGSKIDIDTD